MKTGIAKKPVNNKPADDGTCPSERSLCGTGTFAICVDLQNDPDHCGTCDQVCTPGIACQSGVCQQTRCTDTTIQFSGQPPASTYQGGPDSGQPPASIYPSGPEPREILADVNGDGRLDLVDWQSGVDYWQHPRTFHVSLGQPGGGFAAPDTYSSALDLWTILATDVNHDGADDIIVVSAAAQNQPPCSVEVWLGNPAGYLTRFEASTQNGVTAMGPMLVVGDVSGDGWPDLVMPSGQNPSVQNAAGIEISVYLSDSTGALHLSKTYTTHGPSSIHIRDWNGDGSPDLVMLPAVEILYNRGDGTFEQDVDCGVWFPGAGDGVVADFNRDGQMDVAVSTQGSVEVPEKGAKIGVILGLGGCGFSPLHYYDLPGSVSWHLHASDMNGDGQLDLVNISEQRSVMTGLEASFLNVLLGNPDGTFQLPATAIPLGSVPIADMAIGETTRDQRPDILVVDPDGKTTTLENTCQ